MNDPVHELATELPDHQTSRGAEFRSIAVKDRYLLARQLVKARSQATATNADFSDERFMDQLRRKKETYMYFAGQLGIDHNEAQHIWGSVVN